MKVLLALLLIGTFLASTACGFVVSPSPSHRHATPSSTPHAPTQLNMYNSVEEAIVEAQRICAVDPASPECRVAWDIVEELEAADSHRGGVEFPYASSAASGGAADPSDENAIEVSVMLGSFDILMKKIDGKMDQLQATTVKLHELGATDPSVTQLWQRAEEMKQALADAKASLNE